jgi:imidazolonepropionase-like amidohydrolase
MPCNLIVAALGVLSLAMIASPIPMSGQVPRTHPEPLQTVAIIGASVLSMDGPGVQARRTVLIRDGRITAIGPEGSISVPTGALSIDGHGRFLIPGLVDAHVHLFGEESTPELLLYLRNGITTVRNMHGEPYHLRLRDELARGVRLGPTLYTTSGFADGDAIHSVAEAGQFVRAAKRQGYDAIKVHRPLPPGLFAAVANEARREHIPLVGHAPDHRVGLGGAARAGQRTVEHAESIMQEGTNQQAPDSADIPRLVQQLIGSGVCVTPTLVVFKSVVQMTEQYPALAGLRARPEMQFISTALRAAWMPAQNEYVTRWRGHEAELPGALMKFRRQLAWMQHLTKALSDAGVPIVAGSDAPGGMAIPGFSLLEEMRLLNEAGLSPYQVLAAATRDAARCLDRDSEFGTVSVGKRGDLVLLDRNPLLDLSALNTPLGVVARGRWIPASRSRQLVRPR